MDGLKTLMLWWGLILVGLVLGWCYRRQLEVDRHHAAKAAAAARERWDRAKARAARNTPAPSPAPPADLADRTIAAVQSELDFHQERERRVAAMKRRQGR